MRNHKHDGPAVKRGEIYEYRDTRGNKIFGRYVLVLSGELRAYDHIPRRSWCLLRCR